MNSSERNGIKTGGISPGGGGGSIDTERGLIEADHGFIEGHRDYNPWL